MDEETSEGKAKSAPNTCPECAGGMAEDNGDATMVQCEKCGYRTSATDISEEDAVGGEE